eukprot:3133509-Rhodomonas_salina.1
MPNSINLPKKSVSVIRGTESRVVKVRFVLAAYQVPSTGYPGTQGEWQKAYPGTPLTAEGTRSE